MLARWCGGIALHRLYRLYGTARARNPIESLLFFALSAGRLVSRQTIEFVSAYRWQQLKSHAYRGIQEKKWYTGSRRGNMGKGRHMSAVTVDKRREELIDSDTNDRSKHVRTSR